MSTSATSVPNPPDSMILRWTKEGVDMARARNKNDAMGKPANDTRDDVQHVLATNTVTNADLACGVSFLYLTDPGLSGRGSTNPQWSYPGFTRFLRTKVKVSTTANERTGPNGGLAVAVHRTVVTPSPAGSSSEPQVSLMRINAETLRSVMTAMGDGTIVESSNVGFPSIDNPFGRPMDINLIYSIPVDDNVELSEEWFKTTAEKWKFTGAPMRPGQ